MRVFLFLSKNGDSVPIAERVRQDGCRSVVCTDVPCGDGIVEKTTRGEDILEVLKPDCVYIDAHGIGKVADRIKESGLLVLGASRLADAIRANTNYRKTILKMCGLSILSNGVPFTLAGFFNGKNFVCRLFVIEECYLLDNDLGPRWKSRGCVATYEIPQTCKVQDAFDKVESYLAKANYRGAVSIKMRATANNLGAESIELEYSNALMFAFLDCLKDKVTDTLYGVASGVTRNLRFKSKWMASLAVGLLPSYAPAGIQIGGIIKENKKHIWLVDVVKSKEEYVTAGVHGDILYISARGDNAREARRRIYKTMESLKIEGAVYRTDIGKRTLRVLRTLSEWKYL